LKFSDLATLTSQMHRDAAHARAILMHDHRRALA
jgi:hypothetical protein